MRIIVLVNPSARLAQIGGRERLQARIEAFCAARGIEARVAFANGTRWPQSVRDALAAVRAGDADAIVAGGGDGSIGSAAGIVAGTGVPFGVLPLGTLNHFARDLGIPLDLEAALDVIARGETRLVDIAEVNGEPFVNNASVGFYAMLVLDRERRRQADGQSKWLATVLAALRMLRRFSLRRLAVEAGGRQMQHRTPLLFVGNNTYRLHPPELGTRERLDGGKLWICAARQQSRWQLIWLACRAFLGMRLGLGDLETVESVEVQVKSRASRVPVAVDGEVKIMRPPLRYRSRPGALRVLAPPQPGVAS